MKRTLCILAIAAAAAAASVTTSTPASAAVTQRSDPAGFGCSTRRGKPVTGSQQFRVLGVRRCHGRHGDLD